MEKTELITQQKDKQYSEMPDMVWRQDVRFVQQAIKEVLSNKDASNSVNIISIGQIFARQAPAEEQLLQILETLPAPRLKNLRKMAAMVAIRQNHQRPAAARWLGVSRKTLYNIEKGTEEQSEE